MSENKNRYECDLIQDLLPLYQDRVCSDSSKKVVEEHLEECPNCRNVLQQLKNISYDEVLSKEKSNVLDTHAKKEKRYSTTVGIVTAGILMIPVIVCLICNIAIGHALDWFFIVLASLLVFASITVLPMLVPEKKGFWTIIGFTTSLLLLLLVTCIYTKGNWFFLAGVPVVFGLSVVFMPYAVYQINLPEILKKQKGFLVMTWDTIWLYAIIFVCGVYSTAERYWSIALPITTFCILLPWAIFICIRYCRVHPMIRAGIVMMILGIFTAFVNDVINWVIYGMWHMRILDFDFSRWNSVSAMNGNITLIICIVLLVMGILLIAVGMSLRKRDKNES